MNWNRVAALAALAWGVTVAGAGVVHTLASANTAITKRGGLDDRFLLLLAVGWTLVSAGTVLAGAARALWRGERSLVAVGASGFILGFYLILSHITGPFGVTAAVAVFLLLAATAWSRRAAARSG